MQSAVGQKRKDRALNHISVLPFLTYLLVAASPGPANMAIMSTSMNDGRRSGLAMVGGVLTGSQFWALSTALGMSTLIRLYPATIRIVDILGGLYFIWLAIKALKTAIRATASRIATKTAPEPWPHYYMKGLTIHILNPKAVLGWVSVIALGTRAGAGMYNTFIIVFGCFILGVLIFGTYAIAFSTPVMVRAYARAKRPIELAVAAMFGIAAFELLTCWL